MKIYDRRVSTRNAEGSSEVRKRMEEGGQVTRADFPIAPPDKDKRRGPDTIKPEFYDSYLTMIKRRAAALLNSLKDADTEQKKASVESDIYDFKEETQMTPQQALKQKFRFEKKDKNRGFKPDSDNREA